jgi:hypothetical protein
VLAGLLSVDLVLFSSLTAPVGPPGGLWPLLATGGAGMGTLPLRRRAPLVTFGLVCAHSAVVVAATRGRYTPTVGLLFALYAVASHRSGPVALRALLATAVPSGLAAVAVARADPGSPAVPAVGAFGFAVVAVATWAAGRAARGDTPESGPGAVERRRVTRELHDIVSHSVAVMVLQAAGAARIADTDPARAREALAAIEHTGVQAMAELGRMLGLLRQGVTGREPLDPQPSLRDLGPLLTSLRAAGLAVDVWHHGVPRDLDPSVDVTAYRIVRDTLTGVPANRRAAARVSLDWAERVLVLRVDAGGRGTPEGFACLAARAAAVGGRLEAARGPDGGYAVVATLPVSGAHDDALPVAPGA